MKNSMTTPTKPETMDRRKAHQKYKTRDGKTVQGVTTILKTIAKPALIHWAWQMGMENLDYNKVKDNAGDIGSLVHLLIEHHVQEKDPTPIFDHFTPNDRIIAEWAFKKFLPYWEGEELSVFDCECQMVSEEYRYGGTLDLPCITHDDSFVLLDFKSGKAIYEDQFIQLAAYSRLFHENTGHSFKKCTIVRCGKKEIGDFETREKYDLTKYWDAFRKCLDLTNALKAIDY